MDRECLRQGPWEMMRVRQDPISAPRLPADCHRVSISEPEGRAILEHQGRPIWYPWVTGADLGAALRQAREEVTEQEGWAVELADSRSTKVEVPMRVHICDGSLINGVGVALNAIPAIRGSVRCLGYGGQGGIPWVLPPGLAAWLQPLGSRREVVEVNLGVRLTTDFVHDIDHRVADAVDTIQRKARDASVSQLMENAMTLPGPYSQVGVQDMAFGPMEYVMWRDIKSLSMPNTAPPDQKWLTGEALAHTATMIQHAAKPKDSRVRVLLWNYTDTCRPSSNAQHQRQCRTFRRKIFGTSPDIPEGDPGWRLLHIMHADTRNHWVLLELHVTRGTIQPYVYDGLALADQHNAKARRIARKVADTGIAGPSPEIEVARHPRTPVQRGGYQCGPLAALAMHQQACKGAQPGTTLCHSTDSQLWDVSLRNLLAPIILLSRNHDSNIDEAFERAGLSIAHVANRAARELLGDQVPLTLPEAAGRQDASVDSGRDVDLEVPFCQQTEQVREPVPSCQQIGSVPAPIASQASTSMGAATNVAPWCFMEDTKERPRLSSRSIRTTLTAQTGRQARRRM